MTPKKDGNIVKILQTNLNSSSMEEVIRLIKGRITQNEKTFVVTPNPEFIIYAQENPWFEKILMQSDIAIPDGVALLWAKEVSKKNYFFSRLLAGFSTGLKVIFAGWGQKRITGTDLTDQLCQLKGWANPGPILTLNPQKRILEPILEVKRIVEDISKKQPDLLFVALNMGKQEKFIIDNWSQLKIKLGMGIGGAFDYLSEEVKRAPQGIQKIGFEWLYRLMKEPWRWKRQLALLKFVKLVLKEEQN
jgi:N-acetylglucosaminyldiphosphoundecaprenol N-acetyl-beta-D-mannosaminyltransferase